MKKTNIEVEGGEILIQSEEGHYAVIPAKHRQEVMDMIKDGCDDCINNYIQTLPKETDYAEDGTLLPDWDKVKTTLNPYNWGVKDYTDKGDFNTAYSSARKEGEKEFMWNNKRYNTKSDMPLSSQETIYGNTDAGLHADVAPIWDWRERASQTIAPRELTNISPKYAWNNYIEPFIKGETNSGEILTKESIPYMYREMGIDPQIDMFRKYMGLDQHYNTIVPSAKDGAYDFNEEYKNKMVKDLINAYGSFDGVVKAHNLTNKNKTVFDHKTIDYNEAQKSDKPYTGEATTLYPMGRHQESVTELNGSRVINYSDVFDLDPKILKNWITKTTGTDDIIDDTNNPYKIEGFLSEEDFTKKGLYYSDKQLSTLDINKKNFDTQALQRELSNRGIKLPKSTTKEGTFDGIWGEETKQALLDYQTKNKTEK